MTAKPKSRRTPPPKAPRAAPEIDPWRAIVEAEDILGEATNLTDAINLMAHELGDYECGAICSVANAIKAKIDDGLVLIDAYKKESGVTCPRK
jgi:hypothetical protein